jgi:hypothetical protein
MHIYICIVAAARSYAAGAGAGNGMACCLLAADVFIVWLVRAFLSLSLSL